MFKKIFLTILFVIFIVIPVILIINSMFNEYFGYLLLIEENNKSLLTEYNLSVPENCKAIIMEIESGETNKLILIGNNFEREYIKIDKESNINSYIKTNGIDLYSMINIINYVYIILLAIIIFVKKLLENADMYGKFEERDG